MLKTGYWTGILIAINSMTLIWGMLFWYQFGHPTPLGYWIAEDYYIKYQRALSIHEPKIILLAGSNALFGISSTMLEQALQRPVVNYAVNAGLGLSYLLYSVKAIINTGDLILLPFEYVLYQSNGIPNEQSIDYTVSYDHNYWNTLSYLQRLEIIARMSAERMVMGLRKFSDPELKHWLYGARHLDKYGDQTDTDLTLFSEAEQRMIVNVRNLAAITRHDYGSQDRPNALGWHLIQKFAKSMNKQGICVIAIPPTMMYQKFYTSEPAELHFYQSLPNRVRMLGIPFLENPYDFMYSVDNYFDTEHHLRAAARINHTKRIISLLGANPWQYCSSESVPKKPD